MKTRSSAQTPLCVFSALTNASADGLMSLKSLPVPVSARLVVERRGGKSEDVRAPG